MSPHPRHVTPRGTLASQPSLTSPGEPRVSELEVADHSLSPHVEHRRSAPVEHRTPSSTTSSPLRHVTSRLVFANSVPASERRVSELIDADHSISPHVAQRRSSPHELEKPPKPRSRRCFVCGSTGRHPLDFRVCPRTAVLLRRSLAKMNDDGRLVSIDGSPLPMTRHPGGVAAHLISRFRNPTRVTLEPPKSPPAPRVASIPPHPVSTELLDRVPSPPPTFNSRSPHAIPPIDRTEREPEHIPLAQILPPHPSPVFGRARAAILLILLESMLDSVFRLQLRAILTLVDRLSAQDPSTLRQRIQPVFTRISHLSFT